MSARKFTPRVASTPVERRDTSKKILMKSVMNSTGESCSSNSQKDYSSWEWKCTIAYNKYLQALLQLQITWKKVQNIKQALDDQLVIQFENVQVLELREQELINETALLERKIVTEALFQSNQQYSVDICKVLSDLDVLNYKHTLNKRMNECCDRLFLENVTPVESFEDYKKLAGAIKSSIDVLNKSAEIVGNMKEVDQLTENLVKFQEQLELFRNNMIVCRDLSKDLDYVMFKSLSDGSRKL